MHSKKLLDVTEEEWNRVIDINQKGAPSAIQAVTAQMVRQVPDAVKHAGAADRSYGKIVTFTSISGRPGREYQLAYAASNAAVISLTQFAALAFAPLRINVNAVAPVIRRIPLKRLGTVEDMAGAVAFFCSAEADYITGQTLNVDGGYEMN